MRTFTLTDLKNRTGKVVDAAVREPVGLTRHGAAADHRTAHSLNDLTTDFARDLVTALEAVTPESYGDD